MAGERAASESIVGSVTLRQGALVTIAGYLLTFGTPFASFHALPRLYAVGSAAQTSQNILANQGLFVAAIFAMLANFVGDVLAAWGLYVLLRPVNAAWSMLVAWFRLAYTGMGLTALLHLATAHRLVTHEDSVAAMGQAARDAIVQADIGAFQAEFDFSLIVFGLYLVMVGGLAFRSGYVPKWLAVVLAVNGVGWVVIEAGPYLLPHADFGLVFITTFGELLLLVWLIGWGLRLKEPALTPAPA